MKKLIAMMMLAVAMVGCSSLSDKAENQMKTTLTELANDPKSVEISNVEVVFSTDSIVVIQCVMRSKNGLGALVRSDIEYIYAIDKDCKRESIKNLNKNKSSIRVANEVLEENTGYYIKQFKTSEKYLEKMLLVQTTLNGREIK